MFTAIKKFLATRGVQIVARWVGMLFAIPAVVALLKKLGVDLSPEQITAFAGVAGTAVVGAVLIGIDHFSHAQQRADEAVKKAMDAAKSYNGTGTTGTTGTMILFCLLPFLTGCKGPRVEATVSLNSELQPVVNVGVVWKKVKNAGADVCKAVEVVQREKGL